jgi:3-keto-disaccharide hydrolase
MAERALGATDWRGFAREQFPHGSWSVDGDVLHAIAQGERIDLISRERFGDFTLSFDWRLPRAGSTAVLCRALEETGPAANSGPALQLLDDEHHPEGADALTSCGALYGLMAPWHDLRSSANTYHSARILVKGSAIECWIDDTQVIGCDLASEELKARIARSRFRDLPQFARLTEGHIVLQHRGTEAWFRRLRIEPTGSQGS